MNQSEKSAMWMGVCIACTVIQLAKMVVGFEFMNSVFFVGSALGIVINYIAVIKSNNNMEAVR